MPGRGDEGTPWRSRRPSRRTLFGTAIATLAVVVAAGLGFDALRDRDRPTVSAPAPSAFPSASPTSSQPPPSPTPGPPSALHYARSVAGQLPRATVREVGGEITWDKADEGQQFSFRTHAARFGEGVRPRGIVPTTLEVAFGAVWAPATGGVVRIDPATMQPTDYIPTGDIRAIASSGYASMYAAVETEGRGLGVASWTTPGVLRVAVIDPTPGAADTVLGSGSAVGFAEALYLTRTYPDRPAELLEISPANGTFDVITRMGGPNTRLVVDRIRSDSARDLWVGSSDGVLRHIHPDGTVTDLDLGGPVLDVAAADPAYIWVTVGRAGRLPRPMRVTAATHRVSADLRGINAREIAVEAFNNAGYRVMTSGQTSAADGNVSLALIVDDTGRAFTTSTAHVAQAVGLTFGLVDDRHAFAVSPSSGEVVRFIAEFGE